MGTDLAVSVIVMISLTTGCNLVSYLGHSFFVYVGGLNSSTVDAVGVF